MKVRSRHRCAVLGRFQLCLVADEADDGNAVLIHHRPFLLFRPAFSRGTLKQGRLLRRPSFDFPGEPKKSSLCGRGRWWPNFSWEGPETRRVPRGGKAEERRAARAQEISAACRAREKRRRKKKYQNCLCMAIGETREMRLRTTARWFHRQAWKDANGSNRICNGRAGGKGKWSHSRPRTRLRLPTFTP